MKFLEFTFDEPAANLACDEALLEMMEADLFATRRLFENLASEKLISSCSVILTGCKPT